MLVLTLKTAEVIELYQSDYGASESIMIEIISKENNKITLSLSSLKKFLVGKDPYSSVDFTLAAGQNIIVETESKKKINITIISMSKIGFEADQSVGIRRLDIT